jgi:peptide deformylase
MALLSILRYPDERLHTVASPVQSVNGEIQRLVEDMAQTMYAAPGVGLAATQVDVHKQVLVIDISDTRDQLLVLINPAIRESRGVSDFEEGCLSVPGIYERSSAPSG